MTLDTCVPCGGTGAVRCNHCGGSGINRHSNLLNDPCRGCEGAGKERCRGCQGTGERQAVLTEQLVANTEVRKRWELSDPIEVNQRRAVDGKRSG